MGDAMDHEVLLEQCRQIFDRFDKDGDGSITELELGALLRSLGVAPDLAQVEAIFGRGDENGNELIEFHEFVALIGGPKELLREEGDDEDGAAAAAHYSDEELLELFQAFDKDGNGFITAAELAHSMAKLGDPLSPRELADMMAEADEDGDGQISFQEFAAALTGRGGRALHSYHVCHS